MAGKIKEKRSAREAALHYLERRERTEGELRSHLAKSEYTEEEIKEAVAFLTDHGFLNDALYAEHYVAYAKERGRGPLKIRQELMRKGMDAELLEDALESALGREDQRTLCYREALKALKGYGYLADAAEGPEGTGERIFAEDEYSDGFCGDCAASRREKAEQVRKLKEKLARKLLSRGFSSSVVWDVIKRL